MLPVVSAVLGTIAEEGVTVALAKKVASDPELYRKLAGLANSRIRSLRDKHLLTYSNAYENIKKEILNPEKRKSVSVDPRAGKKYGNRQRAGSTKNAVSLLKFLGATTSTPGGALRTFERKRENFTQQVINAAESLGKSPDELAELREFLDGMTRAQFKDFARLYADVINNDFIGGSPTGFDLASQHVLNKIQQGYNTNKNNFVKNLFDQVLGDKGKVKDLLASDPVNLQSMTAKEMANVMGFEYNQPKVKGVPDNPLIATLLAKYGKG